MDKGDELLPALFLILMLMIMGTLIMIAYVSWSDKVTLGNMVCSEKGLGEFAGFDRSTRTIECEPKPQKEVYDGGWVKFVQRTD